ncbi:MAG TPA: hypothetical protein VE575_16450 [Acidimicrobiales bacterium]|jgi:hypothetical protein|nr:hypothetical protein [Acidimicrobiales bacterium]
MRPLPIESRITTSRDDDAPAPAAPGARRSDPTSARVVRRPGRGGRLAAAVAALAVAAGTAALVAGGSGGGSAGSASDTPDDAPDAGPEGARVAYTQAVQRFGRAGSFAYRGTVHGGGPSRLRPGPRLPAAVTVEGAVRLPQSITREVAIDESGHAVETVTSGPRVWARSAPSAGDLADAPWRVVERSLEPRTQEANWVPRPTRLGIALVADALWAARDVHNVAPALGGRRLLAATVPEDSWNRRFGDALAGATVTIGVDGAGDIARLAVESAAPHPQLELDVDIDRLGEPDVISPADVGEPARRAVAGRLDGLGFEPPELGRLPEGWALTNAVVEGGRTPRPDDCRWLGLDYQDLQAVTEGQLHLWVTTDACARPGAVIPEGLPLRAGAFEGAMDHDGQASTMAHGEVSNGVTAVRFSTDLPATEVTRLLESLQPFDVNNAKTD